jgi:hypothetical protein
MSSRRTLPLVPRLVMMAVLALSVLPAVAIPVPVALAAPSSCGAGCSVTIDARDFESGAALTSFSFVINVDNSKLPTDPLSLNTESNSPIAAEGGDAHRTVRLPDGRYMVSVRSLDHKMWGAYFTLPNDADNSGNLTVHVPLTAQSADHPLPLGKIRVFVFEDNTWTNGAPDTEEGGLGGFQVGLEEQTGLAVTVDYFNNPLCGGICKTATDSTNLGFVEINNLGPATYFIDVHPPGGQCNSDPSSRWYQTTTIDGGFNLLASVEEGADGTGAPGEQLWEPPNIRTAYWFGFVCAPQPFANPGSGEITGTARNWVEWAPYTTGTFNDPVDNPLVALSDASTDQTVYVGRGDQAGNFDIQGVPAGDYNIAIWDEQLNYIMRFKPVHVDAGATVDINDTGDDGSIGVGVSRWFGWLDGTVYKDANGNGQYDAGIDAPIPNTDMDQRWRDGSIKESTFTDANGRYEYPTAEGGALGRWIVNEQGFARFSAFPGASMHDERNPSVVTPSCVTVGPNAPNCIPNSQGGGLLMNQLLLEGHRATVDWGKRDYPAGTPGQIVGITYFATTRNEFYAFNQAHEDYEPAIPDAIVYLETPGPDGQPNTDDDVVVNKYVTDHWQQPNANQDPVDPSSSFSQSCNPIRDFAGNVITNQFNPDIGPNCLEVPLTGQQTKEGAFDGGYAFADYCPNGYDLAADNGTCAGGGDPVPLVAGNYIVHAIMPTDPNDTRACNTDPANPNVSTAKGSVPGDGVGCLYRVVKEEDVNVDLGNQFAPQIPPPPCVGDDHVIDQSTLTPRSYFYTGDQSTSTSAPLCDKKLVVLQNLQNANADFHMMTNFRTDPNGETVANYPNPGASTQTGDVAEPGRVIGQVFNDIYFERNQASNWYGEPRPIAGIPIGIYARVDVRQGNGSYSITGHEVNRDGSYNPGGSTITYDSNTWRWIKTLTTSPDGAYEALLPSTETFNCPIPQGPCPGMYIAIVDDPGTVAHPNANYNPNVLTANTPFEVWPGLTTQLDTPVDPISGTACEDPAGGTTPDPMAAAVPELLEVSTPVVSGGGAQQITISADFIGTTGTATGATGVRATLTDWRTGSVTTLTRSNGGIVSWTPNPGGNNSAADTIVIQVPAVASSFPPGPKQLTITTANVNGGVSSVNGITIHVLGSNNNITYNPPVVNVPPPTANPNQHLVQDAIDGASPGSLIVLSEGAYNENVLVWKPVVLQGLGPGGIIGAHELQGRDPEDPRFNVPGSVIDGRFYQQNAAAFDATVSAHAPYVLPNFVTSNSPSVVLRGADITVVAQSSSAFDLPAATANQGIFSQARIDGLGLVTGHGDGAGGIQLMASINNLQITNNVLENNGGVFAGGIGLGQPFVHGSHNYSVRMDRNRVIGNGGLTTSGGIGVFYGANSYEVANSVICSNFSVEYGAGVSHIGLSPNGSIHDNKIYYNEAVDSGGGIAIESELPVGGGLGDGSGAVNVDRNLIQSNASTLDDGGGIFVLDALQEPINILNNMIVDNLAADIGAGIMLDDASNVRIINNTIANNVTTGSSENSQIGVPHAAGLASEANDPLFQATLPAGAPDFSNPVALFNNIFWNNDAMTLDQFGPGATLVDQGFIDFEVHGTTNNADTFTPRYSDLTNGQILGPNGVLHDLPANQGNVIGSDPLFVAPFVNELAVSGSRLDPQQAAVTITGQDPPVGLTGDYHVAGTSPAVDRGAGFSNLAFPAPNVQTPGATSILAPCSGTTSQAYPADYDLQWRPRTATTRNRTPWDIGADEVQAGASTAIPKTTGSPQFRWNGTGQLQCSGSTVPVTP